MAGRYLIILFQIIERLVDPSSSKEVAPTKPPILTRIKDGFIHYYHGFRLFFLELRVSSRLLRKTLSGNSLSRRELKQVNVYILVV